MPVGLQGSNAVIALLVVWFCTACLLRVSLTYGRGDKQPRFCGRLMQVAGWSA